MFREGRATCCDARRGPTTPLPELHTSQLRPCTTLDAAGLLADGPRPLLPTRNGLGPPRSSQEDEQREFWTFLWSNCGAFHKGATTRLQHLRKITLTPFYFPITAAAYFRRSLDSFRLESRRRLRERRRGLRDGERDRRPPRAGAGADSPGQSRLMCPGLLHLKQTRSLLGQRADM